MTHTRVAILGAGPAGLGAALELAERGVEVDVVERESAVGGHAGSFEIAGLRVDYGSHRLHPAADPTVLKRVRALLGDDLLKRPRHGRIHLSGRGIHFPLRPLDAALRLPPRLTLGALLDLIEKPFRSRPAPAEDTFASVLERGLGPTICREFYFPYARKIWGLEPEEVSPVLARRRVSTGSIGRLFSRLVSGGGDASAAAGKGTFFYPRRAYGQISERLCDVAVSAGARVALGARVSRISVRPEGGFEVEVQLDARSWSLRSDHLWSTIPAAALARLLEPPPSPDVLRAAESLELRAMVLVYLVLGQDRFSECDAHYFPDADIPFTRVSEPKHYTGVDEPRGRTVLCAELPCSQADPLWSMEEAELGRVVVEGLSQAGLPVTRPLREVVVRRLPAAYPIYRRGFEAHLQRLEAWLDGIEGLLTFGRQGLFAHDNIHHALYMAQCAVDCLGADGRLDRKAWERYHKIFKTHVVED